MNFDLVVAALQTIVEIKTLEHATDMDYVGFSVENSKLPAVFYHPAGERALGRANVRGHEQETAVSFALRVGAKNDQIDALRKKIKTALTGLIINDSVISGVEFTEGQVVDVNKSTIYWRDIYTFKTIA
ncbi:phage tail terminator protein [Thiomicrorhabdus lithotrophica]|uniref:Uncharacterized protein n=1 Tax=Thiomicrorhabdus lithotrophica TaxID=2949997 RepID=A0ABY8C873_9GAMM|nr:hypothetical protein [Thiomicrorhabdus lithotrophica]WEJ62155.1 hypothetical protein NR989_09055 [Thiomicrorhabdus lithotrophica]